VRSGLNVAAVRSISLQVTAKYRPLTPKLRADHLAALDLLGRCVVGLQAPPLEWRRFVVVSALP
jgi:hypothetical protein